MVETLTEVWLKAKRLLVLEDWPSPSKESPTPWQRRLVSNESAIIATIADDGVDFRSVVIRIGEITGFVLVAFIILIIVISKLLSWSNDIHFENNVNDRPEMLSAYFNSESLILPTVDKQEIQDVLIEYERLSSILNDSFPREFVRCKKEVSNFEKNTPVVTPFVRKSLNFSTPRKCSCAEHKREEENSITSSDHMIASNEKCTLSEVSLTRKESMFQILRKRGIVRNKKTATRPVISVITPNRSSIEMSSVVTPSESSGFRLIL